ncbi:hypothetical protein GS481_06370 [Rhodococcus hoagii]|nr:hypothetical protein [Prescottella equi]
MNDLFLGEIVQGFGYVVDDATSVRGATSVRVELAGDDRRCRIDEDADLSVGYSYGNGMGKPSTTSAAGTALGYLAQVEYALAAAVELVRDAKQDNSISIELLDDFAVHADSTIDGDRWYQSKHTVDPSKKISDLDVEFWKTISLWIDGSPTPSVSMFLVTNGGVSADSGIEHLVLGSRDPIKASTLLVSAVEKSKSDDIKKYSKSFIDMPPSRRIEFLEQVTLIIHEPSADDVDKKIHRGLSIACRPQHHEAVTEWLRGWWHDRVRRHLMNFWRGQYEPIPVREVMDRIFAIQDRLRSDDLPIFDERDSGGVDAELDFEDAVFVQQLKLISVHRKRIANCIIEHNRAYQQRSYWQRFSLLSVGELERYESILKSEWMRYFLPLSDDDDDELDDDAVCRTSRKNFDDLDKSALPAIRVHVSERFVANGSLHIMADRLEIGWHPEYVAKLRGLLEVPSIQKEGVA